MIEIGVEYGYNALLIPVCRSLLGRALGCESVLVLLGSLVAEKGEGGVRGPEQEEGKERLVLTL